ncbi:MAG: hypothetical protein J5518_08340 [Lachnospiraceae bacterium]|nr:hypothetical protein [Lachnospiraceae bacterium]
MENKLRELFEFQKFEQNQKLNKVIQDTESRYPQELTEDELEMVAAAGKPEMMLHSLKKNGEEENG